MLQVKKPSKTQEVKYFSNVEKRTSELRFQPKQFGYAQQYKMLPQFDQILSDRDIS